MKRSTLSATWVGALAAAGTALLFQGSAHAQSSQCSADEDCGAGFVCKTDTYESCSGGVVCGGAGVGGSAGGIAGGAGGAGGAGDCTMVPIECETVTTSWCSNATCDDDADCPSYMACQPQSNWVCEGGMAGTGAGGDAGGPGGAGGAGECHEVPGDSLCVMRSQLPCEEASDCGGGFDCIPQTYWECSGGGEGGSTAGGGSGGAAGTIAAGAGGAAGGIGGDGSMGECHEVDAGNGWCQLQDLPCESDADCFDGLRCDEQWIYGPCTPAGGTGGAMGGAGGAGTCPEPTLENRCVPLSYMGGGGTGGIGGGEGGTSGTGETGGMAGFGGAGGGGYAGAAGMSSDPGSGNAGAGAGSGGGAGDSDGESDEHGHGHGHGHHGKGRGLIKKLLSGCSAGGPVDGSSSIGWLTLGLAAVVLRRRARRA